MMQLRNVAIAIALTALGTSVGATDCVPDGTNNEACSAWDVSKCTETGIPIVCPELCGTCAPPTVPYVGSDASGNLHLRTSGGQRVFVNGMDILGYLDEVKEEVRILQMTSSPTMSAPTAAPTTGAPSQSASPTATPSGAPSASPTATPSGAPTTSPTTTPVNHGYLWTALNLHTWEVPVTGNWSVFLCGGGGGDSTDANPGAYSAGGRGGIAGMIRVTVPLEAGETVQIGIGGGGRAAQAFRNAGDYPMRGGHNYGPSGSGGGGTFIKAVDGAGSRPNVEGHLAIAGGGGGGAARAFSANFGGNGHGVGGSAYDQEWANMPPKGGMSAWDSTRSGGSYGATGAGNNGGSSGGAADQQLQLHGGNGETCGWGGGGGGGGAGGGGGGGASCSGNSLSSGGYIARENSINGFSTDLMPAGGGGGGGAGGHCGGTGGGGGTLAFTAYNTSWGTAIGTEIPLWRSPLDHAGSASQIGAAHMGMWTGFQELRTLTRTKFQADMTARGASPSVAGKGGRGVGAGYPPAVLAGDGYVFAALTTENAPTGTVELVA